MYTYDPLRDLLERRKMTIRSLRLKVGFSTNVSVAISSDKSITIDNLSLICRYLNVPIEDVVKVIPEEDA